MFLVLDVTIEPEAEDRERGWIDAEAVVHLSVEDAVKDLAKRIRLSLGYELDTDLGEGEPELPRPFAESLAAWVTRQERGETPGILRFDTRDYQHVLMPMEALS